MATQDAGAGAASPWRPDDAPPVDAAAGDARRHAPATLRNRAPLLAELLRRLPARGQALEIASGSGEHVVFFAAAMPGWHWQPSDPEPTARASVDAHVRAAGLARVAPACALDVLGDEAVPPAPAGAGGWDLVFAANLLHIAPPEAVAGLFRRAGEALAADGRLLLYGPFAEPPQPLAAGNQAFDEALRARDPRWGLRPLDAVDAAAAAAGLERRERVAMPANNLLLVYGRRADGPVHRLRLEPDGLTLPAPAGRSLLASALAAGVALPSACRGGNCRRCLMQLRAGRVAWQVDWPGVDAEERAAGAVLPCVTRPLGDVVLARPPAA